VCDSAPLFRTVPVYARWTTPVIFKVQLLRFLEVGEGFGIRSLAYTLPDLMQ
jgi:hypothetical protein